MADAIPNGRVAGAIHAVVLHGDSAWVSGVNGGVWYTPNIHVNPAVQQPAFQPLTDRWPCLSVSAIAKEANADPKTVPADKLRLVAGCGGTSNYGASGQYSGVFTSFDGGQSWNQSQTFPFGLSISDIVIFPPATIVVSVRSTKDALLPVNGAILQSTDHGASWTIKWQAGRAFALAGDSYNGATAVWANVYDTTEGACVEGWGLCHCPTLIVF